MQLHVNEWESVAEAPVIVFVLVAYADGELSPEERAAFFQKWQPRLRQAALAPEQYLTQYREGFDTAIESLRPYTRQSAGALLDRLAATFTMMRRKVRASRVDEFRDTLLLLASDVADASGGFSFLVDATSRDEGEAIALLQNAMDGRRA